MEGVGTERCCEKNDSVTHRLTPAWGGRRGGREGRGTSKSLENGFRFVSFRVSFFYIFFTGPKDVFA
jgi:hypothetical protein